MDANGSNKLRIVYQEPSPSTSNLSDSLIESVVVKSASEENLVIKQRKIISLRTALTKQKYRDLLILKTEHCCGFTRPYSVHQVISWIVYSMNLIAACYSMTLKRDIWCNSNLFAAIIFVDFIVFILAWKTTSIDPSEELIRKERFCRLTK